MCSFSIAHLSGTVLNERTSAPNPETENRWYTGEIARGCKADRAPRANPGTHYPPVRQSRQALERSRPGFWEGAAICQLQIAQRADAQGIPSRVSPHYEAQEGLSKMHPALRFARRFRNIWEGPSLGLLGGLRPMLA